jgi:hypothetical protein
MGHTSLTPTVLVDFSIIDLGLLLFVLTLGGAGSNSIFYCFYEAIVFPCSASIAYSHFDPYDLA